jgi:hypothetical protein
MLRLIRISGMLLAVLLASCGAIAQDKPKPDSLVIDPSRPFVYLKFDHFGSGKTWGEDEVPFRIWFRLVNNCRHTIQVRTFGGPDNALGVMDRVVQNEKPFMVVESENAPTLIPLGGMLPEIPTSGTPQAAPAAQAKPAKVQPSREPMKMPYGYESEVSSEMDIPPGTEAYFSLPANHLSETWHFEIPFTFKVPRGHCCRTEDVGGEPLIVLRYDLEDLPERVQSKLKKR